jgi:hypothetical protein
MLGFYQVLIPSMWLAWLVFWWGLSRTAKATERRESIASRLSYSVPIMLGFALLWSRNPRILPSHERFLPAGEWQIGAGCVSSSAARMKHTVSVFQPSFPLFFEIRGSFR